MMPPRTSPPRHDAIPRAGIPAWALPIGLLAIGVAVAAAVALYRPAGISAVTDPASLTIPSAHDLLPIAEETARRWRPDAYLVDVNVDVHPDSDAWFGFDSASDPKVSLNVRFKDPLNNPQPEANEIRSDDRKVAMSPIVVSANSAIDSPQAFAIALDAGGRSFALEHQEAIFWFVRLQYLDDEIVAWRVVFTNAEFREVTFEVAISPTTGKVLDTRVKP